MTPNDVEENEKNIINVFDNNNKQIKGDNKEAEVENSIINHQKEREFVWKWAIIK